MSQQDTVIGIYDTHQTAEAAIKELQRSNFNMKQLSILGRGFHTEEQVVGFYNTGDRMKVWGSRGAFWGGFWGLLFGSAFFILPGLGPVMVLGPMAAWIVGALENAAAVGGLSALGAGLYGAGIPKDSVLQYETAVKTDKFVVVAHGTAEEIGKARGVLQVTGASKIAQHNAPRAA